MVYTLSYGSYATFAEADKAKKKFKTDNPEACF
jgi:septal ring-binding cell division protein DamX